MWPPSKWVPPSLAQGYLGPLAGLPRPLNRACLPHLKIATLPSYAPSLLFSFLPTLVVGFLPSSLSVHHLVCPCIPKTSSTCRSWLSRARRREGENQRGNNTCGCPLCRSATKSASQLSRTSYCALRGFSTAQSTTSQSWMPGRTKRGRRASATTMRPLPSFSLSLQRFTDCRPHLEKARTKTRTKREPPDQHHQTSPVPHPASNFPCFENHETLALFCCFLPPWASHAIRSTSFFDTAAAAFSQQTPLHVHVADRRPCLMPTVYRNRSH
ncbi:hypothetical protein CFIO01_04533 [Colletotrichum fioriniae PJ7]|uniref:Uncharacterized protein n=1 Tax=Colletotrichum fioriniae PJ7 TaxID=1445577 RepID=A0A010SET0_9PEZI|nr:hypothetical protein CFIO01_04533 [Colletotrichum fioriniae PJ7]